MYFQVVAMLAIKTINYYLIFHSSSWCVRYDGRECVANCIDVIWLTWPPWPDLVDGPMWQQYADTVRACVDYMSSSQI